MPSAFECAPVLLAWTCCGRQIPGECTISGDVRLTPFYTVHTVIESLKR